MRITVLGMGYVGAVAAAGLARDGHQVLGIDVDPAKVERYRRAEVPFYEPGLDELVREGVASGRLQFALPAEVEPGRLGDLVFVAVGTPSRASGAADLSQVEAAVAWVAEQHRKVKAVAAGPSASAGRDPAGSDGLPEGGPVVVMKSTVPPGTGRRLRHRYLETAGIAYVSNPEFLREGSAVHDWFHPDRVVVGSDSPSAAQQVARLFQHYGAPVVVTDTATAEMIKYGANAFLATKISFINELANMCDRVGADVEEVARGIGLDPRIGSQFLRAGLGYGGSCFPKDVAALDHLARVYDYPFELLRAVIAVNARQRLLPLYALREALGSLAGVRVAVLGLAFKPKTDDVREAPALDLIPLLVEEGAEVRAADPQAVERARPLLPASVHLTPSALEALEGAQAVVLATEWDEFVRLDWEEAARRMAEPRLVFDGRNALDPERMMALGFRYRGVGRGRFTAPWAAAVPAGQPAVDGFGRDGKAAARAGAPGAVVPGAVAGRSASKAAVGDVPVHGAASADGAGPGGAAQGVLATPEAVPGVAAARDRD
ncbi:UDP-glucose dehydrogenase family protein [Thermaerobacter subterraneus]|uniref:UDP-glucose 6-dehydrogenase n=1 Tax=Thermaerobacter subterraneus DSM 13965 TaxID=867903 RepID=K6PZS1_9FIRM|nr:UDP-glucose/GDP-mannose dehydrogenase family protein [Thermaerobacter subterraneus]EKP94094.1 nucleotide sugar dehydrogenase [Thermaerobacter subterraneus DSM 13965]